MQGFGSGSALIRVAGSGFGSKFENCPKIFFLYIFVKNALKPLIMLSVKKGPQDNRKKGKRKKKIPGPGSGSATRQNADPKPC